MASFWIQGAAEIMGRAESSSRNSQVRCNARHSLDCDPAIDYRRWNCTALVAITMIDGEGPFACFRGIRQQSLPTSDLRGGQNAKRSLSNLQKLALTLQYLNNMHTRFWSRSKPLGSVDVLKTSRVCLRRHLHAQLRGSASSASSKLGFDSATPDITTIRTTDLEMSSLNGIYLSDKTAGCQDLPMR